ncbi:MAG TPA: DcrB-related protein [Polyangiaceae bacterium]
MTQHEAKDLVFEVPDGWEDRSVVAYAAPSSRANPNAPNIVVTRDKLGEGEDAVKYANRQIGGLAKQLTGFRLQEQRDVVLGGVPAKELVFQWLGSRGRIVQRLAMIPQGSRMINVTTTAPAADAAKVEPVFERILSSMRFGAPTSPPGPAGPPALPRPQSVTPTASVPVVMAAAVPLPSSTSPSSASIPAAPRAPSSEPRSPTPPDMPSVRPPAPLSSPPRSRGGTHQIAARTVTDAKGRARAAAAAVWQRPTEGLVARDLYQYMPWACRHEVVYVTDNAQLGMVVASGAGAPLVFADPTRLSELNAFMRNESVSLPRGLLANDLAQAIRTLLYGPEGYVGSPGFFERERQRYEQWMGQQGPSAETAFRAHCEGAVLNSNGDAWALLFSCFSRHGGVERWEVSGEGPRIRTATFLPGQGSPTG